LTDDFDRDDLCSEARALAASFREGDCPDDRRFDRFLPHPMRRVSRQYWTPLVVARRAAEWFDEAGIQLVADIGSGAGKFCVATALFGRCRFIGVEQYPSLVASARALARLFEVDDRVDFVQGAFGTVPTPDAEAYYFFNPFGDYWFGSDLALESEAHCRSGRVYNDLVAAQRLLDEAPAATWVMTLNGFGGRMPRDYELIRADGDLPAPLRLWKKRARRPRSHQR